MSEKINELLGLLKLDRYDFCSHPLTHVMADETLESAAFRLRLADGEPQIWTAYYLIFRWLHLPPDRREVVSAVAFAEKHAHYVQDFARWWMRASQPKHWIVASRISDVLLLEDNRHLAEEKAKEQALEGEEP